MAHAMMFEEPAHSCFLQLFLMVRQNKLPKNNSESEIIWLSLWVLIVHVLILFLILSLYVDIIKNNFVKFQFCQPVGRKVTARDPTTHVTT